MIRVIIRPMYKTDQNYRKGMYVALLETTTDGTWLARHSDLGLLMTKSKTDKLFPGKQVITKILDYNQIDWAAAGYNVK